MTLAKRIERVLRDELKPEDIKTVIDLAEFLKFKEIQDRWNKIDASEHEYITEEERLRLEETKSRGDFIEQDDLLRELEIDEDEI